MEELLNKLIEKGWKPFGESRIDKINRAEQHAGNWNWCCWGSKDAIQKRKSTRQLVSKESGLWQFVCENGMVKMKEGYYWQNIALIHSEEYDYCDCQYWLIESALLDEDKLEEFLLDNIKI